MGTVADALAVDEGLAAVLEVSALGGLGELGGEVGGSPRLDEAALLGGGEVAGGLAAGGDGGGDLSDEGAELGFFGVGEVGGGLLEEVLEEVVEAVSHVAVVTVVHGTTLD